MWYLKGVLTKKNKPKNYAFLYERFPPKLSLLLARFESPEKLKHRRFQLMRITHQGQKIMLYMPCKMEGT